MLVKEYKVLAVDEHGTKWFLYWEEVDCDFDFVDEFYLVPVDTPSCAGSYSRRDLAEREVSALKLAGVCHRCAEIVSVKKLKLKIVEFTAEV